jgi:hypothetical protein
MNRIKNLAANQIQLQFHLRIFYAISIKMPSVLARSLDFSPMFVHSLFPLVATNALSSEISFFVFLRPRGAKIN